MEKRKKFTSKNIPEVSYEIIGEKWMDKDTYLIVFQEMTDADGDVYHLEVEYHKDDDNIYYSRCYEEEVIDGTAFVSPCFKKQIDEYILQQVGMLRKDSMLVKRTIGVELTLDVPKDMSIGEFQEWLSIASVEVNRLVATKNEKLANKVKILAVENKGGIK